VGIHFFGPILLIALITSGIGMTFGFIRKNNRLLRTSLVLLLGVIALYFILRFAPM
jgi:hypothetical protein